MRGSSLPARMMWTAAAVAGIVLLVFGLGLTLYLGSVTDAFERDRAGNGLILAGAVLGLAAAGWSQFRGDPLRVTLLVAAPAVIIAGLNLAAQDSLLPHIAALAAIPLGLAGIFAGLRPQHTTRA